MLCEHLRPIELAMQVRGIHETYRGQPWGQNCREWIFVDAYIDLAAVRAAMAVPVVIEDHAHRGTHDGEERGFVCKQCHDGIMGYYQPRPDKPVFAG